MPTPEVQFASHGRVAFLTFDRPDARNAMTWPMYDALAEACDRVDAGEDIRVFVLRANGEAFVAGTDRGLANASSIACMITSAAGGGRTSLTRLPRKASAETKSSS